MFYNDIIQRKERTNDARLQETLFAATEDALELLDTEHAAFRESLLPARIRARLTQAQQLCEDIYVEHDA